MTRCLSFIFIAIKVFPTYLFLPYAQEDEARQGLEAQKNQNQGNRFAIGSY